MKPTIFPDWLNDVARRSSQPFVRDCQQMITYCTQLAQSFPEKYGWRFSDDNAIKRQSLPANTPQELNRIYWSDQVRNVEAYGVMTFWRGTELIESALESLNRKDVVSSAVLARSCLEVAATFIANANTVEVFLGNLQPSVNAVVASQEFEELIVRLIWGTRLGDPKPQLKQPNILNVIQKISKNPNALQLLSTYEYLCELAHPNVIGNLRFWSHVEQVNEDGSELRTLLRRHTSGIVPEIVEHVLWALGWSAVCVRNGFEISQNGVRRIHDILGEK